MRLGVCSYRSSPTLLDQFFDLAIDVVERFDGAVIGCAMEVLSADLIQCLLGDPRIGDRRRLQNSVGENAIGKQTFQETDDLPLRSITRLVASNDVTEEIVLGIPPALSTTSKSPAVIWRN